VKKEKGEKEDKGEDRARFGGSVRNRGLSSFPIPLFRFWAVSDLNMEELETLVGLVQNVGP